MKPSDDIITALRDMLNAFTIFTGKEPTSIYLGEEESKALDIALEMNYVRVPKSIRHRRFMGVRVYEVKEENHFSVN